MLKWKPGAIAIAYVVVTLAIAGELPQFVSPWSEVLLAVVFVWTYVKYANGRALGALVWVALLNIFLPLVFLPLIAMGMAVYSSWSELGATVWKGLNLMSFVAPVLAAMAMLVVVRKHAV